MDIRKVKKLIELLEESGLAEIEINEGDDSVRISRFSTSGPPTYAAPPAVAAAPATPAMAGGEEHALPPAPPEPPKIVPDAAPTGLPDAAPGHARILLILRDRGQREDELAPDPADYGIRTPSLV